MKTFKIACLIFAILLPIGVWRYTSHQQEITELVNYWQGRTIVLPSCMEDYLTGDTINIKQNDYIVLRYIDSLKCTSCQMKLDEWNRFLYKLDTVPDLSYDILTVLAPKEDISIKRILKSHHYNHPVTIDYNNIICDSNKFPTNSPANTLLLDKNLKVQAIGDPVSNKSIEKIYMNLMHHNRNNY